MILADSINLPLVAIFGLVTFGPLTLLVSVIEAYIFKLYLKTRFRAVLGGVIAANIASTLAGGVLLYAQDAVVYGSGITESIPAFVRGYRWVGPLLIVAYFAKSLLVEGLWLTQRPFLTRIGRRASRVWQTVLLGNLASYLVVGPLFYIATCPHFAGLETTFDTQWTANPDLVVYYIDHEDQFIKRKPLGMPEVTTLVPRPAQAFIISEDESTVVYAGTDEALYVYQVDQAEPILIRDAGRAGFMNRISLSPDNRRVAYAEPADDGIGYSTRNKLKSVRVFDFATREVVELGKCPELTWGEPIAWSASGTEVYALAVERQYELGTGQLQSEERIVYVFDAQPPYGLRERRTTPPKQSELVVNYGRLQGNAIHWGNRAAIELESETSSGDYKVEVWPYLGSGVHIERNGETVLFLQNQYGLLNLGMPGVRGATFLPAGDELLLDWGNQTYLLSLSQERLGLVAKGYEAVLRSSRFRVDMEADRQ